MSPYRLNDLSRYIYNASWLRERHGHRTPDQIRAQQTALETEAATGFKLAA